MIGASLDSPTIYAAIDLETALGILDAACADGAFLVTFASLIFPYDDNPSYDLDTSGFSLVKSYKDGKQGTACPDMPWDSNE